MAPKRKAAAPAEVETKAEPAAKRGKKTKTEPAKVKEEKVKVKDEEVEESKPVPAPAKGGIEVVLERWSKANKAVDALKAAGFVASVSTAKPRRGAFNFVVKTPKGDVEVWDGFHKGPPRAEKFPDHDALVKLVQAAV